MKQLVISLIGPDKPGLVEQLANVILQHNGNWLASNLSHLAGHFAGIIQVEVSEDHLNHLSDALQSIPKLQVRIEMGDDQPTAHNEQMLDFVITANDRPGIVQELSSVLRHKGSNIVSFTSSRQSAPNWGVPLFNAVATVQLPLGLKRDEVVSALEALATDLVVDIEPTQHH